MEAIIDLVGNTLNQILANPWSNAVISLSLAMYAGLARPNPPSALMEMMNNVFFRVFVLFMVLFMGTRNVLISGTVAAGFVYGLDMLNKSSEGFKSN